MTNQEARKFIKTYKAKIHNYDRKLSTSIEETEKRAISDSNKAYADVLKGQLSLN